MNKDAEKLRLIEKNLDYIIEKIDSINETITTQFSILDVMFTSVCFRFENLDEIDSSHGRLYSNNNSAYESIRRTLEQRIPEKITDAKIAEYNAIGSIKNEIVALKEVITFYNHISEVSETEE